MPSSSRVQRSASVAQRELIGDATTDIGLLTGIVVPIFPLIVPLLNRNTNFS